MPDYTNESQQVLMRIMDYLIVHVLQPKTAGEIQEALDLAKDTTFRALWNMLRAGWVEKTPQGGYLVSPRITTASDRFRISLIELSEKYLNHQPGKG